MVMMLLCENWPGGCRRERRCFVGHEYPSVGGGEEKRTSGEENTPQFKPIKVNCCIYIIDFGRAHPGLDENSFTVSFLDVKRRFLSFDETGFCGGGWWPKLST